MRPSPVPMVHLITCKDPIQAEFFKSFLAAEGLHVHLSNDRPGWTGRYSTLSRGVRLEIPQQELTRARALIKEAESGKYALTEAELIAAAGVEEDADAPDAPYRPKACPGCGSGNVRKLRKGGLLYLLINLLFLGMLWMLTPDTWACSDCGWEWTRDEAEAARHGRKE